MIKIIISILFLLFVTSLSLTLFTIIKHTEKVLPVLEQFKWPLASVPQAEKLGTLIKYEVEKNIADKLISINDLDNKYNIYFVNEKTKNSFIFDVKNYDFVFYYAKINDNNYYVPSNYVYLNSKTNVKPQNSQYSLGIVLSENKDNNIQTSENLNLFDLITHNIEWKLETNPEDKVLWFIAPIRALSFNNFITGHVVTYNNRYNNEYGYFYIDKENIIHILSNQNNNELMRLRLNENYQLVNIDNSESYIPSMLIYNIGYNVSLVKLLEKNPVNIDFSNIGILTTYAYNNDNTFVSIISETNLTYTQNNTIPQIKLIVIISFA